MTCSACARARSHLPRPVRQKLESLEQWLERQRLERKLKKRAVKARQTENDGVA